MAAYDTTTLITAVKRRALIPTNQNTFATADFLSLGDEEIQSYLVPMIMRVKSDYYETDKDSTIVSGTASYRVPPRAIGGKLSDVFVVTTSGRRQLGQIYTRDAISTSTGTSYGFYMKANSVVLYPTPGGAGETLRMTYYIRPNQLVASSAGAVVSTINAGTKTITTASTIPATFTTGAIYDLIKAKSGFECLAIDQAVSVASGTTLTFSSALPADLVAGDYICLAEQTMVPQIPAELHPVLYQRIAVKCLEALGDDEGMKSALGILGRMEESIWPLIDTRVDKESIKLKNNSGLINIPPQAPWFGVL